MKKGMLVAVFLTAGCLLATPGAQAAPSVDPALT